MGSRLAFTAIIRVIALSRTISRRVYRLALVSSVLLGSTAAPADATFLYDFQSGGAFSFSWTQEVFKEDFWVFNDPYDGNPDGPLLTLTEEASCDVDQIVVDGNGILNFRHNEIEVFGRGPSGLPHSCGYLFGFSTQRFDHLGTYFSGGGPARLTISEVPENGPTWLLSALAIVGVYLTRRRLSSAASTASLMPDVR